MRVYIMQMTIPHQAIRKMRFIVLSHTGKPNCVIHTHEPLGNNTWPMTAVLQAQLVRPYGCD